ncbi:hypothetical protein [Nannocystis sp.]|uniref:hypothetical protein n=1 Tax=Nannocystis sp. TaxID=1962667 RepID=UPI0025E702A0|nr:hypothetical protein [Nannocystis sp.]MBK7829267.1 hypothetical protein [Nannocystis sp.]
MRYSRDSASHVLASLTMALVACGDSSGSSTTTGPTTNETGSVGSTSIDGGSGGSSGSTVPTTDGSGGVSDSASDTGAASTGGVGPKFDVGGGGNTDVGGNTGGPGSCRPSEIYGAAGGFPAFTDPNYAAFLNKAVAIVTHNNWDPAPNNFSLTVVDISGDPPPPNLNYLAPLYHHPTWTLDNLGKIFGLTLDSDGNLYVAPTTAYGANPSPATIKRIDGVTGEITAFATLPNNGPAMGNLNYDCVSQTIYVSNFEDGRIYQIDMNGKIVSTYHHQTGDVTMGPPADPGEPDGQFAPLGQRPWAIQSNAGRLYYSVWVEHLQTPDPNCDNEVWSVGYVDKSGVPDPATAKMEFSLPTINGGTNSTPVSDISFAQTGWMLVAQRTMSNDNGTSAHQSTTFEYDYQNGTWVSQGTTYVVGELLPYSAAGGVDHDFDPNGYVWMTGDALDFYTPDVVYGLQGTPYGGGGVETSTLIDLDHEITQQDKTVYGDVEVPIPGDAMPVPPPS